MNIAEQAYFNLNKEDHNYNINVKYSGKFKPYNANVKKYANNITFNLSKNWRKISKDIRIGLMQELLVKLFKLKTKTTEMELYNIFMQNIHISIPKTKTDPSLEYSFKRLNNTYFSGLLEQPNLAWGSNSVRKLGSYEYGTDTITISTIFKGEDRNLLDYVMYHEMLHKKLKFNCQNGRARSHTPEFRKLESLFPNSENMEKELQNLARKKSSSTTFKYPSPIHRLLRLK